MKRPAPAAAGIALAGLFLSLLWLERRRPLRRRVEPQLPRLARNVTMGAIAAAVVGLAETPVTQRLAAQVQQHQVGLVHLMRLPSPARRLAALVLLDYTLYLWHILMHRVPGLWRWHRVHHRDPDLDVSTALRFQAMELLWSVPWRAAQVLLIGVDPATLRLWGQLTLAEVMFHHSNLDVPGPLERLLRRFVVTPAMHGLHHADRPDLQHANFSSGLALWDRLHGTAAAPVPHDRLTMGVPPADRAS